MIKKVLVESDGFVSNIFHDTSWQVIELKEGQTLEDREYEQIDGGWYLVGQKPLSEVEKLRLEQEQVNNELKQIENKLLNADERYRQLDKTTTQLEQLKHYKLDQLNELCNKAIVRGFVCAIESKEYLFSASVEAQGNFQGTDALFKEGLIQDVYWSVTNVSTNMVERVRLDNDLFNQVKVQLFNHINTHISKFRDFLQPLVLEASTNSEVDNINW